MSETSTSTITSLPLDNISGTVAADVEEQLLEALDPAGKSASQTQDAAEDLQEDMNMATQQVLADSGRVSSLTAECAQDEAALDKGMGRLMEKKASLATAQREATASARVEQPAAQKRNLKNDFTQAHRQSIYGRASKAMMTAATQAVTAAQTLVDALRQRAHLHMQALRKATAKLSQAQSATPAPTRGNQPRIDLIIGDSD